MKLTALQEYGLRCLLVMARQSHKTLTISQIAEEEGISKPYVAKILRVLHQGRVIESLRGKDGGYRLREHPSKIFIAELLEKLGGQLFSDQFCEDYAGDLKKCIRSQDCSLRPLWKLLNSAIAQALSEITLQNLTRGEVQVTELTRLRLKGLFVSKVKQPVA